MFVLLFDASMDINKVYAINTTTRSKVTIKSIKRSKLILRCKRCQANNYNQKSGRKEACCVKCTGHHLTTEFKKAATVRLKRIHCGEDHPANYHSYLVNMEFEKLREKNMKTQQMR